MSDDREFLLQSLRDLEAERAAGDMDTSDYETLRDDYTARAAAALRGEPADVAAPRRRPWLVVTGLLALAIVAGLLVANAAGQRMPDDAATGSITDSSATQMARARQFIADGQAVEALKLYDTIIKADPKNAEALAYRGWLLRLAGLPEEGLKYIDRAIAADSAYPDAHFFRGVILWRDRKDPAGAVPEFRAFLASNPPADRVAPVEEALRTAEAEAAAAATTATTGGG